MLVDGEPVSLGPPKQRALLVRLALAGRSVSIDRLVDDLWPERPPPTARQALQVYASGLRKVLRDPSRIVGGNNSYTLRLEPSELDLARFRALVAEEHFRDALSLWRGHALAGLEDEPGARDAALDLEHERLEVTERLAESELGAGRHSEIVAELERLVREYPGRERLHELLMLALYRCGRQADALDAYGRARAQLRSELGLEPSEETRALQAAILRHDPALNPTPPDVLARTHLPPLRRATATREREVGEIAELVASDSVRLVTLVGAEDVTAVALSAGERAAASFADGVWYVELADLDHFKDRDALLVVDGVLPEEASALSALLREAPRVRLLVTSPQPLGLYGEHRYELGPAERGNASQPR